MYPQELPFFLGPDVCGAVEAAVDEVTAPELGDLVTTAHAAGAYAEYCVAPADIVTSVPDGVTSDIAAASILTSHALTGNYTRQHRPLDRPRRSRTMKIISSQHRFDRAIATKCAVTPSRQQRCLRTQPF